LGQRGLGNSSGRCAAIPARGTCAIFHLLDGECKIGRFKPQGLRQIWDETDQSFRSVEFILDRLCHVQRSTSITQFGYLRTPGWTAPPRPPVTCTDLFKRVANGCVSYRSGRHPAMAASVLTRCPLDLMSWQSRRSRCTLTSANWGARAASNLALVSLSSSACATDNASSRLFRFSSSERAGGSSCRSTSTLSAALGFVQASFTACRSALVLNSSAEF